MKLAIALAGLMLLQNGGFGAVGPAAELSHMRYERAILLPGSVAGPVCAVLDAAALAHAASRSGDDLRVFAERDGMAPVETPFTLTESEAAPGDAEPAAVSNLALKNGAIGFDLAMPRRAYTAVDLRLAAKDFVGTAKVWGVQAASAAKAGLGSFPVFDLSGEGLARSTTLPLREATFPVLHVELRLQGVNGGKLPGLSATMVRGADVPPSREAQTLYTVVATTEAIGQQGAGQGSWTVAKLHVPEHVPVERLSFVLGPGAAALGPQAAHNFLRAVMVVAKPDAASGIFLAEAVDGEIWRVMRAGSPAINQAKLSMDAVLASNLRAPATVAVTVNNGKNPPLPIRAIELEMRQREVCFQAAAGGSYTLRYGDAGLAAPAYPFQGPAGFSAAQPFVARLGPERIYPGYVLRARTRSYRERHPELLWVAVLLAINLLGALAIQGFQRLGRPR